MKLIHKKKTGKGYHQLLSIHKSGGCYDDTKNNVSTSIYTRTDILKDLIEEQDGLCAYCMKIITIENATIEHIIGQSYVDVSGIAVGKQEDTNYDNMLAVCDGKLCQNDLHCDKSRAKYQTRNPLLFVSPLNNAKMQNISFTQSGKIQYDGKDKDIENDLNKILNLNCTTLVENRKRVKDAVTNQLVKKRFDKTTARKLLEVWMKPSKEYSQVAIQTIKKHI